VAGQQGEFEAIERIRRRLQGRTVPPAGQVWIGDDAAVLGEPRGVLLLATDATVEGVHGDLALMNLDDLGWRAVVATLSDIAAMGGSPLDAVVAVAGPASVDLDLLFRGVADAAEEHGCHVVGGDLSAARQLVVVTTVTGVVETPPPPVLRSGAAAGHLLFVTGPLGGSAAGLRALRDRHERADGVDPLVLAHLRPGARIEAGEAARSGGASAMIDVSDGLAADLWHLADASKVGFELQDVPVFPGASLDDALGGGEDYELVIAVQDAERLEAEFKARGLAPPILMGRCVEESSRRSLRGEHLKSMGYEHRFEDPAAGDRPRRRERP
jgi:thiamine-monophosphate kinase